MLAVGDSTILEIIFSTRKSKGQVSKRPKISTNEGSPDKHVQINANVIQRPDSTYPIIIEPYKLDLSQFSDKIVKEKKFTIRNVSDQKLKIVLVSAPGDLFDLDLPKSIKPGKSSRGKLKLKKEAYGETFQKSITFEVIEVEDEKISRFTIPVKRSIHVAEAPADTTSVSKRKASP